MERKSNRLSPNVTHAAVLKTRTLCTCANSRRTDKSLRLQNADLLIEHNLFECDLARPPHRSVRAELRIRLLPQPVAIVEDDHAHSTVPSPIR